MVMTQTISLEPIRDIVRHDMAQLNQVICESLKSNIPNINMISEHITQNPGKRLRPLLTILGAKACGYQGEDHITLAAIIELIHTATLLHDDVVDESTQRRGYDTANAKWGNPISVLVGDFLYSRSFQLMAKLNNACVFRVLADTSNLIAEGEVLQLINSAQANISETTYLKVIYHKTAKLFESACQLSGVVAHASSKTQAALAQYGQHFGMAYQLVDDILDYTSEDPRLGKNTGDDFRQQKVTLPLIEALTQASPTDVKALQDHIHGVQALPFTEGLAIMQKHKSFTKAQQQAAHQLDEAQQALQAMPSNDYSQAMAALLSLMHNRSY
jgi:octaprenyl-diphosphate synthase